LGYHDTLKRKKAEFSHSKWSQKGASPRPQPSHKKSLTFEVIIKGSSQIQRVCYNAAKVSSKNIKKVYVLFILSKNKKADGAF
jgi:hypothetical protein